MCFDLALQYFALLKRSKYARHSKNGLTQPRDSDSSPPKMVHPTYSSHASAIKSEGFQSLSEGDKVEFHLGDMERRDLKPMTCACWASSSTPPKKNLDSPETVLNQSN